jgi:ribosomal protein S20
MAELEDLASAVEQLIENNDLDAAACELKDMQKLIDKMIEAI